MKAGKNNSVIVILLFLMMVSPVFQTNFHYSQTGSSPLKFTSSHSLSAPGTHGDDSPSASVLASNEFPTWTHYTTPDDSMTRPVAISADGTTIVEGSNNKTTLLDSSSNESLWSYDVGAMILDVAISDDGGTIVAGTMGGLLYVFERDSSTPLWMRNCSSYVVAVAVSGNGTLVTAGDWSGRVYAFNRTSSSPIWDYMTGGIVTKVSVSQDGSTVAAVGFAGTIYVFGLSSNSTLWSYHTGGILYGVSLSSNASIIAAASLGGVYIFSRQSNATLWTYSDFNFYDVEVSRDGSTIVAGRALGNDKNLFVWDVGSNATLWTYNSSNQMRFVSISSDGEKILSGNYNHLVYMFHKSSNKTLLLYDTQTEVLSVSMSEDGMSIVSSDKGGRTTYFRVDAPRVVSFGTSRSYYNASESIVVDASIQRGTFNLSECVLHLSTETSYWSELPMVNSTPLNESVVSFSLTVGPFKGGVVSMYLSINDTLSNLDASETQDVLIDSQAPIIDTPQFSYHPPAGEPIHVSVNVTDEGSGVDSVTLLYSNDSMQTWHSVHWSSSNLPAYEFILPAMENGARVQFYLVSTDKVGNTTVADNAGDYYVLEVLTPQASTSAGEPSSPVPFTLYVGLAGVVVLVIILILKRQEILSRFTSTDSTPDSVSGAGHAEPEVDEGAADDTASGS